MKKNIVIVRCKRELSDNTFYSISDYVRSGIANGVLVCPDYFDVEVAEIDVEPRPIIVGKSEISENVGKAVETAVK